MFQKGLRFNPTQFNSHDITMQMDCTSTVMQLCITYVSLSLFLFVCYFTACYFIFYYIVFVSELCFLFTFL